MRGSQGDLKGAMDALCEAYRSRAALDADPISVPMGYAEAMDRELASWVAAHLAYGRVAPMLKAIRRLLSPLGKSPTDWLRSRTEAEIEDELRRSLGGWVWRFHTLGDMVAWLMAWKRMDASSGFSGMESLVLPRAGERPDEKLSELINGLRQSLPQSPGIRFNLPDPLKGAACKRWRMFLRWMVRRGWPDFGIWKDYPAAELVIPLDTHVHRISRLIGLCSRRSPDAAAAAEITAALKELDPTDPVKYDFALAHLGIMGGCAGKKCAQCVDCPLVGLCLGDN